MDNYVTQILIDYVKKTNFNYAIMLDSWWGSGKTYYVKNQLNQEMKKNQTKLKHISLFNMKSLNEILKKLIFDVEQKHKSISTISSILGSIFGGITKAKLNVSIDDLPLLDFIKFDKKLIVLDDLERANIDVTKILGFVSDLVENYGAKILLVCNEEEVVNKNLYKDITNIISFVDLYGKKILSEDEIKESVDDITSYILKPTDRVKKYVEQYKLITNAYDEYNLYKEKVVFKTLKFEPNLEQAYDNLIEHYYNDSKAIDLMKTSGYKKLIIDSFNRTNRINYRTVIFSFEILYKIIMFFEEEQFDYEDYKKTLVETYIYEIVDIVSWYKSNEYKKGKIGDYHRGNAVWAHINKSKSINYNLLLQSVESGNFAEKVFENIKNEYIELISSTAVELYNFTQIILEEEGINQKEKIMKGVYEKLKKDEISINFYMEIYRRFFSYETAIGKDNYTTKCLQIMLKNLDTTDKVYKEIRTVFVSGIDKEAEKYKEKSTKLKDALLQSRERVIKSKLNTCLESDEWLDCIKNFNNSNSIQYTQLKKFIGYFNIDLLFTNLIKSNIKTIIEFRKLLQELYSFSNLYELFKGDRDKLCKLKKIIDKTDKSHISEERQFHLVYLINDLESYISLLC